MNESERTEWYCQVTSHIKQALQFKLSTIIQMCTSLVNSLHQLSRDPIIATSMNLIVISFY